MTFTSIRFVDKFAALVMIAVLLCPSSFPQQQTDYVFRTGSELVLVNVTVRDKSGNFVQGLKPENFTILEDNKPQKVVSFDVENVDAVPPQDVAQVKPLPESAPQPVQPAASPADAAS